MQVRDELRVLVEAEVERAVENFKKLESSIKDSEQKTQDLDKAIDSLSKNALVVAAAIGGAGIASVKLAGENEKLQISLKNMLGSAREASVVFEEWRKLGNSPGLSTNEVFELGQAMVNMGHNTAYATQTIQMLGDVAAGTGKSFGTISGAFERVRAQERLSVRDLTNLQQQGIPILKQLAKNLNTSEEGVRRLVSESKVGFPELERAFRSMTGPGGQFAGMMDELSGTVLEKFSTATSDAKQALAAFGELLLPIATDLLESASSIMIGITEMDEGTKKLIVGTGGLVAGVGGLIAISVPAIKAIKSMSVALAALAANPVILAAAGGVAGIAALLVMFKGLSRQVDQAAKDYNVSLKNMAKDNQNLLQSSESFEDVARRIRGLTRGIYDAAKESGDFTGATEAAARLLTLSQKLDYVSKQADQSAETLKVQAGALISVLEMPVDPGITAWWEGYATEIEKINAALEILDMDGYGNLYKLLVTGTPGWTDAVASQNADVMLQILKSIDGNSPEAKAEIERIRNEIHALASGSTILPPADIPPEIKKRWQDWYGEITKIDPDQFGNSGAQAVQLYLGEFNRSFEAGKAVSSALGEEFDIAGTLRKQQADIEKTLIELFSIDPSDIDHGFTVLDNSIEPLIAQFKRLGSEIKAADAALKIEDLKKKIDDLGKSESQLAYEAELARLGLGAQSDEAAKLAGVMNELSVKSTLADLGKEVRNLGKDQYDLALATMAAANATEEEIKQAEEMIEVLRRYGQGFDEFLSKKTADGLMKIFPDLEEQAANAIGNISAQLASISFDSLLGGLSAVGEAFAAGGDSAENFKQAMADMAQQVLNQLPMMFLQAGLQLIASGQWPLGLGFIAAAGSSAIISGYVNGKSSAVQENAQGGVYDEYGRAARAFAAGGAFTNQIVSSPTYFRHGGGLGLMGEAGPEAIMPLKRMANGDLGVQTGSGGSTQVVVNIINNSGAEVRQEETADDNGNRQIDVIIGNAVNQHLSSGKADRVMGSRYGLRAAGV